MFSQNRAEIDWSQQPYVFLDDNGLASAEDECFKKGDRIIIHNAGGLKVRADRIISDLLKMTRNKLKRMRDSGDIIVTEDKQKAWMEIRLEVKVVD